ncbi:hypothetical protein D3C78_1265070 [compost metagenome]
MIAVQARTGLQAAGVGTGLGLGQRERAEHGAAGQRLEELLFLLIVAELEDRHTADRVVHAHDGRTGTIAGGDFFQGHGVRQVPGVATAPLFRHQHAEEAQLRHLANGFFREAMLAIPLGGKRLEPLLGKLPCRFADL